MDKKIILVIALLIIGAISYQHRFEIVPVGNIAYILDRWTGEIRFVAGKESGKVKEGK